MSPAPSADPVNARMQHIIDMVKKRDPGQNEFYQAFAEMTLTLEPLMKEHPKYLDVLEFLSEPERCIIFRVPWVDDQGNHRVNRAFRIQFSSVLGPYKGGLRFHPTVDLSIMKFLGFEQIFKNALTGLPMGGGKGGTDFNPQGKSEGEMRRFCQSFMSELYRHIGPNTDVPAGDIGVGGRELGYMFGQYRRLVGRFEGALTGKGAAWGGSLMRPEATGYGVVYFALETLKDMNIDVKGLTCVVSGSGNVAQFCAEKLLTLGAVVLTFSDSSGYVIEEKGFTLDQVKQIMHLKNVKRGRVSEYTKLSSTAKFVPGKRPWCVKATAAFPCATQNEVEEADAKDLVNGGCKILVEGANMPTTQDAIHYLKNNGVVFCPAKAANAGGVAVSGLEMSQNSLRLAWTREEVDDRLKEIMRNIYKQAQAEAVRLGHPTDIQMGVNSAAFSRVADAVIEQGFV